jgi:hypothetical protein
MSQEYRELSDSFVTAHNDKDIAQKKENLLNEELERCQKEQRHHTDNLPLYHYGIFELRS